MNRTAALVVLILAAAACGARTGLGTAGDAAPAPPDTATPLPDAARPDVALPVPDAASPVPDAAPPIPDAAQPGPPTWAVSLGGNVAELAEGIAVDSAGHVLVVGGFAGTASFGSTKVTSQGSYDLFVVRLKPDGSTDWVLAGGGAGHDAALDVALDGSGNAYVTGELNGKVTLGGKTVSGKGSSDLFLARITPAGQVSWLVAAGGSGLDRGLGVAVDSAGNGYVTGSIGALASFGPHTVATSGLEEVVLARFTKGGSFAWAKSGASSTWSRGRGVALAPGGEAYLAGELADKLTLGGTTLTGQGYADLFVARVHQDGSMAWVKGAGGYKEDRVDALAVDPGGQAYLAGFFTETASFGGTKLKTLNSNMKGLYLTRLTPSGDFAWALMSNEYGYLFGAELAASSGDGVRLAGHCDMPTTLGTTQLCQGLFKQDSVYIVDVSSAGTVSNWLTSPAVALRPTDMAVDITDAVYLLGYYPSSVTLGGTTLSASGIEDIFVWKVPAP